MEYAPRQQPARAPGRQGSQNGQAVPMHRSQDGSQQGTLFCSFINSMASEDPLRITETKLQPKPDKSQL